MSLNQHLSLKIVRGEEIRKVQRLPSNWEELRDILQGLYGTYAFHVTYIDEENDHITISDTEQLHDLYEQFRDQTSLKLYIKALEGVEVSLTCEGCNCMPSNCSCANCSCAKCLNYQEERREASRQVIQDRFPQYTAELQNPEFQEFIRAHIDLAHELKEYPETSIEHPGITCDSCGKVPINGIRYKCAVCPNFDFCGACERFKEHDHPFIKIRQPMDPQISNRGRWGRFNRGGGGGGRWMKKFAPYIQQLAQGEGLGELANVFMKNCKLKLKMVEHTTLKKGELVLINVPIAKTWKVKNAGMTPWPAGLILVFEKGNVQVLDDFQLNAQVKPGETVEIHTTFMITEEGVAKGFWKLQGEKSFGNLKVHVTGVECEPERLEKLKQLVKMGFTIEQAKMGLQETDGDLEAAVSHIFSTIN